MISLREANSFAFLSEVAFVKRGFVQSQIDSKDLNR
jgi:hypothetical protein